MTLFLLLLFFLIGSQINAHPLHCIYVKSISQSDKKFIDSIKGQATIIPIYQINARNVNLRINKYPTTTYSELNSVIAEWSDKLESNGFKGKTKENFLSVFKYLDECISKIK